MAAQIERLLHELELYIETSSDELRIQMTEMTPTIEEYQERRMGTSAVGVLLAVTE